MTKRVLVTRPDGTWPELAARFAGSGVVVQLSETTVWAEPVDPRPGDDAIDRLLSYDWLVVTSGRGVAALRQRLTARGMKDLPPGLRLAAVGPATARALSAFGWRVALIADEANSEGLIAAFGLRLAGGVRVVVVRPEGAQDVLPSALRATGAIVDEAPLYRTIASPAAPALADAAIAGAFAAVVFTAPSSIDLWLDAAGSRRDALFSAIERVARVAIGPTTSARLLALNLPVSAVAQAPSEGAVGDAIARALGINLLR